MKKEADEEYQTNKSEFENLFYQKWDEKFFTSAKNFEKNLHPNSWLTEPKSGKAVKYPQTKSGLPVLSYLKLENFQLKKNINNDKLNLVIKILKNIKKCQQIQQYTNKFLEEPKMFCNLNLIGTRTGRLSTTEPNLQSFASVFKTYFKT